MTEKTYLCKCTFCLKENINGIFLNQNTYNHHCIRIQEFSEKDDDIKIGIKKKNIENIENIYHLYIEENMHIEENINLNTEKNINLDTEKNVYLYIEKEQIEKDIDDDSNTESFNFNEEDIEYYSDYDNK